MGEGLKRPLAHPRLSTSEALCVVTQKTPLIVLVIEKEHI